MLEHIRALLEKISQDQKVFINLILAEYDSGMMALIRDGFIMELESHRQFSAPESGLPEPQEVSAIFYAAGLTGAIIHWIKSGLAHPVEDMAACLTALLPPAYSEASQSKKKAR